MSNQPRSFFYNVDWLTILLYVALCAIGLLNIYSAVPVVKHTSIFNVDTNYGKQFIFIISSIVIGIIILLLESRLLSALAPAIYGITVLLLILVLLIGRNVGGNQ